MTGFYDCVYIYFNIVIIHCHPMFIYFQLNSEISRRYHGNAKQHLGGSREWLGELKAKVQKNVLLSQVCELCNSIFVVVVACVACQFLSNPYKSNLVLR